MELVSWYLHYVTIVIKLILNNCLVGKNENRVTARHDVLTAVLTKGEVFWEVTPRRLVSIYDVS
jgi:hypothetical protein